ncbi:MAG: carboxypeptidase regulatory-like domain-containing protein [Pyrinomonadaceae bacterium]|nr:carboxypeptidase regulatory-like domain-containing protein [Pyrinomonadaceae bacterium]
MKRRHSLFVERCAAPLFFASLTKARRTAARKSIQSSLYALASLCLLLGQTLGARGVGAARALPAQGEVVSLGVLPFQDDGGTGAPAQFGQKVAQELQQKLNAASKNLLARPLNAGADASSINAMSVEQLAALGKQNGVKFVVRGGLLAANAESAGAETKLTIQLYADVISVEAAIAAGTVRAEGTGTHAGASPASVIQWESINLAGGEFLNSALGQAFSSSLEQLAASIQQAIASPVAEATTEQSAQTDSAQAQAETGAATEAATAEADEELQQLVAQAESLISGGTGSVESLTALNQSLKGLKAALSSKAALLEQAQDTAQADAEVAARKEELQVAVSVLMQEVSTAEVARAEIAEVAESAGEKKGLMSSINDFMGESLSILQKIQEIRAAFRGADEECGYDDAAATDAMGEGTIPAEESVEEVSGVVTESGEPVEGVTVTEPESGVSDTTGSDGAYSLNGLVSGKLTKLLLTKGGKQMALMHVDMPRGRSATADFELKSASAKKGSAPALRILPPSVLISRTKATGGSAGTLKGVVRDAQGRPVPRALVSLKGLALARTDSRGQYLFMNVPSGNHQLSVHKSGLRLKTHQVQVAAKKSTESKTQFAAGDRIAKAAGGRLMIARGTGTLLRGVILDSDKRPMAGAKITAIQSASAVSVLTGSKGNYELRDLKPGAYKILVSKVGYEGGTQTAALRAGVAEQRDVQLKKKSSPLVERVLAARRANPSATKERMSRQRGGTTVKVFPTGLKTAQLTGRVVDAQTGGPIQNVNVSVGRQQSAKTDQAGSFTVSNLPPGEHRVSAGKAGFLAQEKTVTIRPNSNTREDFTLKPESTAGERTATTRTITPPIKKVVSAGQLRGRVVDAKTGKPVPGAAVSIMGQRGVVTDQNGVFAFANLMPGTYQVSVRKSGFSDGSGTLAVRAGQTAGANFSLSPKLSPVIRMKLPRTQ